MGTSLNVRTYRTKLAGTNYQRWYRKYQLGTVLGTVLLYYQRWCRLVFKYQRWYDQVDAPTEERGASTTSTVYSYSTDVGTDVGTFTSIFHTPFIFPSHCAMYRTSGMHTWVSGMRNIVRATLIKLHSRPPLSTVLYCTFGAKDAEMRVSC